MIKLIKLELRRNNIKSYQLAVVSITIFSFIMQYMFAVIGRLESDSDLHNYVDIMSITRILTMVSFSILGAVMYTRFVINEYTSVRGLLLLSYPLKRNRIYYAKIVFISLFITGGFFISDIICSTLFLVSE